MDSKRLIDTLKQIPLQILFLLITGLISVFVMMIPGLLVKAIIWFGTTAAHETVVGIDYIIVGVIGVVACFIAMYQFMQKPGVDCAIYAQRAEGDKAKLNPLYPIIIIVASMVIYTLICMVADFRFIADPVKYFATFFGKGTYNAEMADIAFNHKIISFVILIVCEIPAMFLGYAKGFKERMAGNSLL